MDWFEQRARQELERELMDEYREYRVRAIKARLAAISQEMEQCPEALDEERVMLEWELFDLTGEDVQLAREFAVGGMG